jgi:PAS domain S-box-containing protein
MPLDLKAYDPNIPVQHLPPESRYGFFSDDGIMIWRNLDPEGVIGTRPNAEAARRIVEIRDGEFESLAIDGVIRFFSVVPMPETGWVAFIGVPATAVYVEARRHAVTLAAIALGAIAVIGALALAIARRIAGPVAELETTARAVHEGNLGVRAAVAGPSEIAEVAREFNAMIEAQQRSHAQLRAFLDNSAVIAWLKDEQGRFIFVSDNFLARFALRREAVIGRTDHDIWPKEQAEEFRRNDEEILAGNADQEVMVAARNPDGGVSWWLASKFAYTDAGGRRVIGGLAVDITQSRQAEAALRESEERFRDLTELSSDWFWEQDAAFRFTLLSGELVTKGGFIIANSLGKCRWELPTEGVGEAEWAQHRACLERHEPFQDFVYRIRLDSGEYHWYSINGKPFFNPDGSFRGYRGTGNDITERKLAEEGIRHLNATLEQRVLERTASLEASNRELEAFSYSVSHDLRAPLRALDGFSYLLKEEYADRLDEAGQEYLRRIRDASQRMGTLIDDLIELARISRLEMKRVKLDLTALALEVAETLQEQSPQRKVIWDMTPDLRANADPVLAKALMDNLVRNAWKFTAERAAARIEVGCMTKDGETVFFVRDDGAGFDQTYANKLFKPFQRLHDAKRFPGTGIGLATVMRVVRRHGGRVWAEGAPDRGAAFYFTLP